MELMYENFFKKDIFTIDFFKSFIRIKNSVFKNNNKKIFLNFPFLKKFYYYHF